MQLVEYFGAALESFAGQPGACGSCTRGLSRAAGPGGCCLETGRDLQEVAVEYSWAEAASATGGFGQDRRLGRGASGVVYRGTLHEGTDVAVKVIEAPVGAGFQDEVRLLSRCRHPNVVMLLGFAREESSGDAPSRTSQGSTVRQRALVYELLPGGDAHARLHTRKAPFPWRERLQTAIGVSRGLAHLHRHRPEIFHRDIKTQNILFGADGTAKIADFGLACVQAHQEEKGLAVDDIVGTLGYADPLDEETGVVTEANEVYSFGMVLLELLTGCLPATMAPDGKTCVFFRDEIKPGEEGCKHRVLKRLDARAQWSLLTASGLVTFALLCIHGDVDRRPSFLEAATLLQEVAHEAEGAPDKGGKPVAAAATASTVPGGKWTVPLTCDGRPPQTHGKAIAAALARQAQSLAKAPAARSATVQRYVSATVVSAGHPSVQVLCSPGTAPKAAAAAPKAAAAPPKAPTATAAPPKAPVASVAAAPAAVAAASAKGASPVGAPPRPGPKASPVRSASATQLTVVTVKGAGAGSVAAPAKAS